MVVDKLTKALVEKDKVEANDKKYKQMLDFLKVQPIIVTILSKYYLLQDKQSSKFIEILDEA